MEALQTVKSKLQQSESERERIETREIDIRKKEAETVEKILKKQANRRRKEIVMALDEQKAIKQMEKEREISEDKRLMDMLIDRDEQ